MKILIFEYASSGVASAGAILTEGFAMLSYAIGEAKKANYEVATLLDPRIAKLEPVKNVEILPPHIKSFKAALKEADAALIIAPETDLLLYRLARMVEKAKIPLLGCTSNGIRAATDKAKTIELLRKAQVSAPLSRKVALKSAESELKDLKYPLIFKPADGVGAAGISLVRSKSGVKQAINKVRSETKLEHFLIEEYIEGEHSSVGIISTGEKAIPVTLNSQRIEFEGTDLRYMGNSTPLHHPLEREAKKAALKAVLSIKGLRGYAGVDMVLTEKKAYIIEINPRLTTSSLIAGRVAGINIVKAISDAVLEQKMPSEIKEKGFAAIERVASPRRIFVSEELARDIWNLDGVVSPPLAIGEYIEKGDTLAFISKYGREESSVAKAVKAAKQKINRILEERRC